MTKLKEFYKQLYKDGLYLSSSKYYNLRTNKEVEFPTQEILDKISKELNKKTGEL